MLDPKSATLQAPARFKVKFATTKGDFVVEVVREWAPRGADRFFNLVKIGFYQDMAVYRVVKGFVVQFGLHGDPKVSAVWRGATIMDEMVSESNKRGYLTYAKSGADSRTTQLFISLHDNPDLDRAGFSPFAKVVAGMEVVDRFYAGYAEKPSAAGGQKRILAEGNAYLKKSFPRLDYIKSASIVE
ncbi:MAG: peptidylprolyl isomerase [Deltaproteobacteria bacterium]|nr:peptidylprolyl isomerase [Deltaproteobacteria bacterium]